MRRKKSQEKRIAQQRIEILFSMAEREAMRRNLARASRYVALARKIGMRYRVNLRSGYRRRFCQDCGEFMLPSVTARVRIGGGRIVSTCLKCGRVSRHPYIRERRLRINRRTESGWKPERESEENSA